MMNEKLEKLSTDLRFLQKHFAFLTKLTIGLFICFIIIENTIYYLLSTKFQKTFVFAIQYYIQRMKRVPLPDYSTMLKNYFLPLEIKFTVLAAVLTIFAIIVLVRRSYIAKKQIVRGARLASKKDIKQLKQGRLPVGEYKIPENFENRGLIILGTAGTGKSVLMRKMIDSIAGETAIIYDRKGEFLEKFWSEGDLILNFLDERHLPWNLYSEIHGEDDIDSICASIVPHTDDPRERFWRNSARDILKAVITKVYRDTVSPDFYSLAEFIYSANTKEKLFEEISKHKDLKSIIEGYISGTGETSTSVFASYTEYANYFKNTALLQKKGGDFSIREFIKSGEKKKIFILNPANVESFRGLNTLFLDLAFKEILSLPDDINRRIFLFIDEFPSLYKLDSLERLLAEGRSKGSCPIIAAQDFTQIERIYEKGATSIFNNANTKVIFRISEARSAKYISDWLGEQEKTDLRNSLSLGTEESRDGYYFNEEHRIDRIVLPSEIANLPDLNFYLKIGNFPLVKGTVKYESYESRTQQYIPIRKEQKEQKEVENVDITAYL